MEGYSRDLLRGIGAGENGPRRGGEQEPRLELGAEEVELSLGLSLGSRFGLERRGGERLARSSSVACILAPEEVALPPLALARTSSLPTKADVEAGKKQTLGDWSGCRGNGVEVEPSAKLPGSDGRGNGVEVEPSAKLPGNDGRGNGVEVESSAKLPGSGGRGNGVEMEPAARLPASGSPSSGSSDGEGQRLKDTLMRTSSLPAGIEDEWRKRKEAQTLKRLEVKKKRIERRSSSNVSKEATGQILEEMNAGAERVQSCEDVAMGNKQIAGDVNHSNAKHHSSGLPPKATHTSQGSCLSGMPKRHNSAMKGTCSTEEQSLSSAVPSPAEGANGTLRAEGANSTVMATPSSSALAVRAAALGSRAEQQHMSGRLAARAKSMGDVERMMMQEMPCVCTKGLPNGRRVEGFLYKYRKGDEVRIVCVCHGSFLTPAEFVKHAGGGDVANPLRHIVVNPIPPSLF